MSSTIRQMVEDAFAHFQDALISVGASDMPDAAMEPIPSALVPVVDAESIKAAGIMFVEPGGSVLMLKRGDGGDYPGLWCFPGGKVETGETIEEAAERETIEELGFLPKGDRVTLTRQIKNGVDFTTFLQAVGEKFMPETNGEHSGFMWVDLKTIETEINPRLDKFREADHPRDADGKFGSGGGSGSESEQSSGTPAVTKVEGYSRGMKASGMQWADRVKVDWRKTAPKTVPDIVTRAAANQIALAGVCETVAEKLGIKFANPGPKSAGSLTRKIEAGRAPERITDAVRGGFDVQSPEDGEKILEALSKDFAIADEGWQKNAAGYFDRKTMVRFEDGQVGEIQMWPPGMLHAKEQGGGHHLYEEQRLLPEDSNRWVELQDQMIALYAEVETKLPATWKSLFREGG